LVNNEGLIGTTEYLNYIRQFAKTDVVISGFDSNLKYRVSGLEV
jgi:hypothetical protein